MNFISSNYIPDAMIAELISSKNKEIDWLKEEIKFLRGENEKLLRIVVEKIWDDVVIIMWYTSVCLYG